MSYFERWRLLGRTARLYLLHVALQTFSLAIFGLFFRSNSAFNHVLIKFG